MSLLPLVGLALVDSLSVGTFVIPLGLIIVWRGLKPRLFGTYLLTILIAYFGLGMALLLGFTALSSFMTEAGESRGFTIVMLIVGILLAAYGILAPTPKKRDHTGDDSPQMTKLQTIASAPGAMVSLALGACVIEAATMLPYLAAVGIVKSFELPSTVKAVIMAGYCIVMIVPALIAGVLARIMGPTITRTMARWQPRLEYEAKVTLLWIAAIAGIIIAVNSFGALSRM